MPQQQPNHPLGYIPPEHHTREEEQRLLAALGLSGTAAERSGLSTVCDFCERPQETAPPAWYYPVSTTAPIEIGGVTFALDLAAIDNSGWVACTECHTYIDAGDYAGLARFRGYPEVEPLPFALASFRDRRNGPAQPL